MNWGVFLGAFAGSLIELVEILAVVLVVGSVAGWRNALVGASGAVGLVVVAALITGKGLALIPLHGLEIFAGLILLAFGQMWTRSVIKYYGGALRPKDDEDERLRERLRREGRPAWNLVALAAAFKSSLLESMEIAVAVVGFGAARGDWVRVDRRRPSGRGGPRPLRGPAPGAAGADAGQGDEVLRLYAADGLRHLLAR